MRRIIPGSADRRYGIHVARLAGLPQELLDRAETILKGLEAEDGKKPDAPAVSAAAEEVQSNLFSSSIIDELAHADVMGMTPIEAMNMLFRLSKEAKEGR